jgi:hypothetical protein
MATDARNLTYDSLTGGRVKYDLISYTVLGFSSESIPPEDYPIDGDEEILD